MTRALIDDLVKFRNDRGWAEYHSPRNLAHALMIEAGELNDEFIWGKTPDIDKVADELADVMIYAHYICERYGFDPETIIRRKMEKNALKYPVDQRHDWA